MLQSSLALAPNCAPCLKKGGRESKTGGRGESKTEGRESKTGGRESKTGGGGENKTEGRESKTGGRESKTGGGGENKTEGRERTQQHHRKHNLNTQ